MKVAIAGAGDLARYFVEELVAQKHEVVVLSRSPKPWFNRPDLSFRMTDYSIPSLVKGLYDCEGLVSALLDYSMNNVNVHVALLEACRQSPKCKRYIPLEYGGNVDDFPDQPAFYFANHEPVRNALKEQTEVMWTLFNLGWLTDYLIPENQRYIKDIGDYHPLNHQNNTLKIPGTGTEPIAFTSARDAARAISRLFIMDCEPWENTTYVCGETTTWNDVARLLEKHGHRLRKSHRSVEVLEKQIADARSEDEVVAAQYEIWSISGSGFLPQEKLKHQADKYFKGLKFRNVEEILIEAEKMMNVEVAL
ncbi:Oxidoreductase [Lachnellula occidentalis]|uniref:Oxidoreductase n=1 Tax=Lachnellula occidentalis TaxID=215460 RepID=A0A8H8U3E7_9HELO|nr:Oxidoreductase [Lachnellula occidentalis]